ncbi:hypothetical protein QBC32DRAFT_371322 [Pseudoneurospora amorphoporcata]|uniref:Uncharacterized protein n=1 Tax=Pseudoneurospora amorphoporcata TaxID=241081 RepID=A0AAN6NSI1_9PEZI|nr:hypothetical protein QBC32DRAFT_371322 [Pseudoneurospora amorphoporcata]
MSEPQRQEPAQATEQPLKRTFHGCLTCRKRKVRSFDTNLRIRVSTPTGAKDVETTSSSSRSSRPTTSYQRESHYQHQYQHQQQQHAQQHQQQPMPAFMAFDEHSQSFVPEDPNHFPGAGYPTSITINGSSTSYANFGMAASSSTTGTPDMSQFQYQQQYPDAAAWEYDYPYDPNDPNNLGYDYDASLDVSSMQAPLPDDLQHGGHQDASAWYGYPAQGGSNQQQNWR